MPFSSLLFLLGFLPVSLALDQWVRRYLPGGRVPFLVVLSFVFYAWWDVRLAPLLACSIAMNWLAAELFVRTGQRRVIPIAITLDLLLLGAFKYLDFFTGSLAVFLDVPAPHYELALPVGISFFTFQHVMYLMDLRDGRTGRVGLLRYALYVAFFPRVIAGPLVRPSEFMPNLERWTYTTDEAERLARGFLLLIAGLAKKVFLADPLGALVNPVYAAAETGASPNVAEAWQAALGYTFQLYFDFSGYTDMALGIALLFGNRLPQNFNAPYRADSIQDFWRRWHITLSLFLRDYLYIRMGGSRHGLTRQLLALFATMALGGLWHGAGWTFVAWGSAHGVALGAHVLWRKAGLAMPAMLGMVCTFTFVALAWVLFRAPNFGTALAVYKGLFGFAPQGTTSSVFWPMIAVAAILALVGPTSWDAVRRAPPARWVGVAASLLLVAVLLKVGDDANFAFLYAQF
jgi:alginate O-acetyltransferase complex protein AlgI